MQSFNLPTDKQADSDDGLSMSVSLEDHVVSKYGDVARGGPCRTTAREPMRCCFPRRPRGFSGATGDRPGLVAQITVAAPSKGSGYRLSVLGSVLHQRSCRDTSSNDLLLPCDLDGQGALSSLWVFAFERVTLLFCSCATL